MFMLTLPSRMNQIRINMSNFEVDYLTETTSSENAVFINVKVFEKYFNNQFMCLCYSGRFRDQMLLCFLKLCTFPECPSIRETGKNIVRCTGKNLYLARLQDVQDLYRLKATLTKLMEYRQTIFRHSFFRIMNGFQSYRDAAWGCYKFSSMI